ncbi:hypothetical protein [Bradyrhizobium sp. RDT46]|uniref:hypothetical protein n=1 Tax=Bradyrhizobium sp. RDT46 TaxID=3341829 RepID=UPI0035C69658
MKTVEMAAQLLEMIAGRRSQIAVARRVQCHVTTRRAGATSRPDVEGAACMSNFTFLAPELAQRQRRQAACRGVADGRGITLSKSEDLERAMPFHQARLREFIAAASLSYSM